MALVFVNYLSCYMHGHMKFVLRDVMPYLSPKLEGCHLYYVIYIKERKAILIPTCNNVNPMSVCLSVPLGVSTLSSVTLLTTCH